MRFATLRYPMLPYPTLRYATLRYAILRYTTLRCARLCYTILRWIENRYRSSDRYLRWKIEVKIETSGGLRGPGDDRSERGSDEAGKTKNPQSLSFFVGSTTNPFVFVSSSEPLDQYPPGLSALLKSREKKADLDFRIDFRGVKSDWISRSPKVSEDLAGFRRTRRSKEEEANCFFFRLRRSKMGGGSSFFAAGRSKKPSILLNIPLLSSKKKSSLRLPLDRRTNLWGRKSKMGGFFDLRSRRSNIKDGAKLFVSASKIQDGRFFDLRSRTSIFGSEDRSEETFSDEKTKNMFLLSKMDFYSFPAPKIEDGKYHSFFGAEYRRWGIISR